LGHCEEHSDEAIQHPGVEVPGLLRCARNDGGGLGQGRVRDRQPGASVPDIGERPDAIALLWTSAARTRLSMPTSRPTVTPCGPTAPGSGPSVAPSPQPRSRTRHPVRISARATSAPGNAHGRAALSDCAACRSVSNVILGDELANGHRVPSRACPLLLGQPAAPIWSPKVELGHYRRSRRITRRGRSRIGRMNTPSTWSWRASLRSK
jgi:hypothetical protein